MGLRRVLLALLVLALSAGGAAAKNKKADRGWKSRKRECERFTCSHLVPDEAMNCVNECTSAACFQEVYGEEPLEDGEVDPDRRRLFTSCLRKEARELKKQKRSGALEEELEAQQAMDELDGSDDGSDDEAEEDEDGLEADADPGVAALGEAQKGM